jgi:hypothetical protein
VAEIRVEHRQRGMLPWLIGLALVALVVIGLTLAYADSDAGAVGSGPREVGNPQEEPKKEEKENKVPRRLQYWASIPAAGQPLAA